MECCETSELEILETLSQSERALLLEILHAIRSIQYGSLNLTLHEGRVVEISKTKRVRLMLRNGRE